MARSSPTIHIIFFLLSFLNACENFKRKSTYLLCGGNCKIYMKSSGQMFMIKRRESDESGVCVCVCYTQKAQAFVVQRNYA